MFKPPATGTEDSSLHAVMFKPPATGIEDSSLHAVMFKPPATGSEDSSLHAVMFKPPATGTEDSSLHAVMFKPPATGTEDSSLHAVMFKPPATGTEDSSRMFKPPAKRSSSGFRVPVNQSGNTRNMKIGTCIHNSTCMCTCTTRVRDVTGLNPAQRSSDFSRKITDCFGCIHLPCIILHVYTCIKICIYMYMYITCSS